MIKSRKSLTLQLTPLLDLLLIVIFAQYLDVQKTAASSQQQSILANSQASQTITSQQSRLIELQSQSSRLQQEYESTLQSLQQSQTRLAELQRDNQTQQQRLDELSNQRMALARFLKSMFENTARQLGNNDSGTIKFVDELTARIAAEQTQQLANSSPEKIIRHVLTYEEVIKRCDLWDIFVLPSGVVSIQTPQKQTQFRINSAEDFSNQVFAFYKSLSQPKGLVIMLYSYGDARADVRQSVELGIPLVAERMRADAGNLTRFEFANLGYQDISLQPQ